MKVEFYEYDSRDDINNRLIEINPRTIIVDVEPLIAYWDTTTADLDCGLSRFFSELSPLPSLKALLFVTNSRRRPSTSPSFPGVAVGYHANALKPFRIGLFRELPAPGVVVGDQLATDGLLARRLDYTFIRYQPKRDEMKLGPAVMSGLGRLMRPFFFRSNI